MRSTPRRQSPTTGSLAAAAAVVSAAPAAAESHTWKVDSAHTEINFSVNHFFTPVTGSFEEFEVILDYDAENPASSTVEARIEVASVNTGNQRREDHLRSADWFEAEKHPYMTFKSTRVRATRASKLGSPRPARPAGHPANGRRSGYRYPSGL